MPRVSVCIPSYQHKSFVKDSIYSVIAQTYQDFEMVVTDDGSTDGTVDIIESINDPRLKLKRFPENRGACCALNDTLQRAEGEYVCFLPSDDIFLPNKLEQQVAYLDAHPEIGAVFSYPVFIDEGNNVIPDQSSTFNGNVFLMQNRSQSEWLRHFFFVGNCLCHPSLMIRKNCYAQLGAYDERLAQLPDFEMWIRLLTAYPIHIMPEPLVGFRILNNGLNASAPKPTSIVRINWEDVCIRRQYANFPDKLFAEIFEPEIKALNIDQSIDRSIALGRICMATNIDFLHRLGLELLHDAIPAYSHGSNLKGITYAEYIQNTGNADIYNVLPARKMKMIENILKA
ncbi:glycosyltransferase [Acetobacter okinawensis]|uniref:glycosyltransferase n=1 Tax=Acetobacter okinawensis TaxID=1076594 RepID=UPI00046FF337|nr:glycosyltransferase [Acetobacter okinawensis]